MKTPALYEERNINFYYCTNSIRFVIYSYLSSSIILRSVYLLLFFRYDMDLDAILPDVGEFGSYQQLLLWFVLLPGVLPCGFHAYNQLFMAAKPEHWCHVPQLDVLANFSNDFAKNIRQVKYRI